MELSMKNSGKKQISEIKELSFISLLWVRPKNDQFLKHISIKMKVALISLKHT
jgi:hypothetical protein